MRPSRLHRRIRLVHAKRPPRQRLRCVLGMLNSLEVKVLSQPDGGDCVKKTSNRHAVRKMKVGPSEPPCRRRLQTAISCFGPKTAVVNVMVKRRGVRSRHVWIREMSANDPPRKHRKQAKTTPKTRVFTLSWDKHERYLLTGHAGVRCIGGMTLIRAFVRNLRTGSVMQREKAQVENPRGQKYRCTDQGRTAS